MNSEATSRAVLDLSQAWRIVARHADIEAATTAIFVMLQRNMTALLVRRWSPTASRLDSVAGAGRVEAGGRDNLSEPLAQELLAWARLRQPRLVEGRDNALLRAAVPAGMPLPCWLSPLVEDDALVGLFALSGTRDPSFAAALQEPHTVALANDHREHELLRLREAAELDRAALLSRLSRGDVSEAIVGAEAGLREVMARVAQVAPTDAPVLILGETGSGKEVVARAIHARSARARGPFLRVNCGAIPPELVDSELFGHERGSFTGAISQRKGWFERADGGTLFLDEVGDLPPAAQVRLLRVLQDGSFQRVGGQQSHNADVRIVTATHRAMSSLVHDGRFREDLWYRISVFPITLPSLRQRRGDIPALARHFSEQAGLRLFSRALSPSPEDLALLHAYDWPGNVRELAAVIERAAILGDGRHLAVQPALGVLPSLPVNDRASLESALRASHGRIEGPFGAAAALGVNPHTLRSRLRRLGVDWSRYRGPA